MWINIKYHNVINQSFSIILLSSKNSRYCSIYERTIMIFRYQNLKSPKTYAFPTPININPHLTLHEWKYEQTVICINLLNGIQLITVLNLHYGEYFLHKVSSRRIDCSACTAQTNTSLIYWWGCFNLCNNFQTLLD